MDEYVKISLQRFKNFQKAEEIFEEKYENDRKRLEVERVHAAEKIKAEWAEVQKAKETALQALRDHAAILVQRTDRYHSTKTSDFTVLHIAEERATEIREALMEYYKETTKTPEKPWWKIW